MDFWDIQDLERTAIITTNRTYTYKELNTAVQECANLIQGNEKSLVLIICENRFEVLVEYLAALRSGHAVMLVGADLEAELLENIVDTYQPKWIFTSKAMNNYEKQDVMLWKRTSSITNTIHPDLALLLSTSGTTGSRKFVRLSYKNIQSNAEAIAQYLKLNSDERAVVNLPLSYSYGLSIVNSHLAAGATILLTNESVMEKSFWSFLKEEKATSFPGVPFTYQMLQRIGFTKMDLPHLRSFTQAGGRLDERLVRTFAEYARENKKQFYVMYGQTEAAPRMSYIPSNQVIEKAGTIGIAVPGGAFEIAEHTGELIYQGPNVMMGYAEKLADLEKGDELQGLLHTGDTAKVDEDGFYSITGRLKRFIKLFGLRINLDEVERRLEQEVGVAVACAGNDDRLIIVVETEDVKLAIQSRLDSIYKLHKSAFRIKVVESIPRMVNGKTDYVAIKAGLL